MELVGKLAACSHIQERDDERQCVLNIARTYLEIT